MPLDLADAVKAIRSHQPTKDVVPEWLVHAPGSSIQHDWFDDRVCPHETTSGQMHCDAARLIVEACMWRYGMPCQPGRHPHGRALMDLSGQYCATRPNECRIENFGPDLLAALMFAAGVPTE